MEALLSTWRGVVLEAHAQVELDRLKAIMSARGEAHTKRMLGILAATQGTALVTALAAGWRDAVM